MPIKKEQSVIPKIRFQTLMAAAFAGPPNAIYPPSGRALK